MEEVIRFEKSPIFQEMNMLVEHIIRKCELYVQENREELSKIDIEKNFNQLAPHIEKLVNEIIEHNKDYLEYYTETYKLNNNWLNRFVEEILVKLLTGRNDLHIGNLGITNNGYFRFFDSAILS